MKTIVEVNFKLKYLLNIRQFEQGLTLYTLHLNKYVVIIILKMLTRSANARTIIQMFIDLKVLDLG
jgi:hypothetical protein